MDVSIINKKGIDKGLTLGSELHSIEEVNNRENIVLKMRSGIQVILQAKFAELEELSQEEISYGPSSKVRITGKILNAQGNVMKDFSESPLFIPLEESSKVVHSKDSQLVEVSLRPHLK